MLRLLSCWCFVIFVSLFPIEANGACPTIKTRRNWGANPPLLHDYQLIPVNYVIVQHTVTPTCATYSECAEIVLNIQGFHMNTRGWPDIAYNFLIGNDGNVYEAAGWHKVGTHTFGYNRQSLGIAFIGDFSDELPSCEALEAAKTLLECGVEKGELGEHYRLLGARQVTSTISPGQTLYNEIKNWDNWVAVP